MKYFLAIVTLLSLMNSVEAQDAPARSTPFTAVKWEKDNPYVLVSDEWNLLLMVDDTEAKSIVDFCKSKDLRRWQKRFSEDFAEVLIAMGKSPKVKVKLRMINGGKTVEKLLEMTTDNRRKVRDYNKQNPPVENAQTKEAIVEKIQKDIASAANIKIENLYQFKSAKFVSNYTGHKIFTGTETVYIDDYGKTVIVMLDKPHGYLPEKTTTIWRANQCTTLNHNTKTYFITKVRPKSTEPPVIAYSSPEQRKQAGYLKKANETLLSKECEVYGHAKMNIGYWLWKGYALKEVNFSLGNETGYTKEPKSVEENVPVPESLFTIPADYKK